MVFVFSLRSAKILVLFLLPPLVLSLLWFAIPLNHPASFFISMIIYYLMYFMAWLTFFDFIWPNCPNLYLALASVSWLILSVLGLVVLWFSGAITTKWSINIVLGIVEVVCSTGCYLAHILHVRKLITRRNQTLSMAIKKGLDLNCPAPRIHRHWTKPLYSTLCYWNGLDDIIEEQETAAQLGYTQQPAKSNMNQVNEDGIHVAILLPYQQWSVQTMIWALVFKLVMSITWYFLQGFIELNSFLATKNLGEIRLAVVGIIIFQLFRAIFINLLIGINAKLPASIETAYFAPFALQAMFFFYYRNLFLTYQGWLPTVAINIVVFFFQVLIYPVYMTKTVYNFRFKFLKNLISTRLTFLSCFLPFVDGDVVSHERHVKDLCVEYYYDQVSEYYSLVCFIIFVSLERFVFTYNHDFYKGLRTLDDNNIYGGLLQRYAFLFAFEVVTDILLRYVTKKVLQINIASIGRNTTIYNYRARFLFTVFLLFFLSDVYYSLIRTSSVKS